MRALKMTRRRLASALAVVAAVAVACQPAVEPLDQSLGAGILTPDYEDHYGLTLAGGVVTAAAPASNKGGNTRVAFWQVADQSSVDQQSCATWVDARSTSQQQGAALRVRSVNGRTTAITVTNNIWFGARWIFNVHVMDSGVDPRFHQIASFDLSEVFRPGGPSTIATPPYPWRMCARVVGDTLSFIVWPLTHAEPGWDDPRYGGSVTLPAGWGQAGNPGWYVGHLEPGGSVGFTELTTAVVAPPPPTTTTSTTTTSTTTPSPTTAPTMPTSTTTPWSPIEADEADVVAPEPTTPSRQATWVPIAP